MNLGSLLLGQILFGFDSIVKYSGQNMLLMPKAETEATRGGNTASNFGLVQCSMG